MVFYIKSWILKLQFPPLTYKLTDTSNALHDPVLNKWKSGSETSNCRSNCSLLTLDSISESCYRGGTFHYFQCYRTKMENTSYYKIQANSSQLEVYIRFITRHQHPFACKPPKVRVHEIWRFVTSLFITFSADPVFLTQVLMFISEATWCYPIWMEIFTWLFFFFPQLFPTVWSPVLLYIIT